MANNRQALELVSIVNEAVWSPMPAKKAIRLMVKFFHHDGWQREPFGQGSFLECMSDPPKTTQLTQQVPSDGSDDLINNP